MEIKLELNEKPDNPTGDEICLKLNFGYLIINFHPPTINKMIK